jgi:hypothetical protein
MRRPNTFSGRDSNELGILAGHEEGDRLGVTEGGGSANGKKVLNYDKFGIRGSMHSPLIFKDNASLQDGSIPSCHILLHAHSDIPEDMADWMLLSKNAQIQFRYFSKTMS